MAEHTPDRWHEDWCTIFRSYRCNCGVDALEQVIAETCARIRDCFRKPSAALGADASTEGGVE